MPAIRRNRKVFIAIFLPGMFGLLLTTCLDKETKNNAPRGRTFAGSAACRQCHKEIYDGYLSSSHYMATRPATAKNIRGSFAGGQNVFSYSPSEKVVMEKRDSGTFQVAYVNGRQTEAQRFDITFGVKHSETYLYWKGDKIFELPISYFTSLNSWTTSPGYPPEHAKFDRVIGRDCFECHTSYIDGKIDERTPGAIELFNRQSLVYGIDCERCHGGSINHVNYHLAYPAVKQAKYIVTHSSLTRQQSLDMCAICHAGNDKEKEVTSFKFKLGDTLANFFSPYARSYRYGDSIPDIHGNQYHLLASSQCFIKSKTLTCITCHDPHKNASANLIDYESKCISCHQNTTHSFDNLANGSKTISNCVQCHMPEQPSKAITYFVNGKKEKSSYMLRTHKISVYKSDDSKVAAIIELIKNRKKV